MHQRRVSLRGGDYGFLPCNSICGRKISAEIQFWNRNYSRGLETGCRLGYRNGVWYSRLSEKGMVEPVRSAQRRHCKDLS